MTAGVAVVGGGPAGLMAAQALADAGVACHLFDRMPSVGRKFLLAGKGGLNLTHAEDFGAFVQRYGPRSAALLPLLQQFGPQQVRDWAASLGVATFVGSSGRIFPTDMKAAPLLRAWLHRLRAQGVQFHMRHHWRGFAQGPAHTLCFDTPSGPWQQSFQAVVLALGGGSWARLGSDGAWVGVLQQRGIAVAPLQPSNCGFDVAPSPRAAVGEPGWSRFFIDHHAGAPLKAVAVEVREPGQPPWRQAGEFVVTQTGVEGSLVYAASARLRDAIAAQGQATLWLDLLPQRSVEWVQAELAHPRGPRSLGTHLKSRLGLQGVKAALLNELVAREDLARPDVLAARIKALPIVLRSARPLDEAISTAGGVVFEGLDEALMLRQQPGLFMAGEMLDWEAATGGYLLTACLASGWRAGQGAGAWAASAS